MAYMGLTLKAVMPFNANPSILLRVYFDEPA